MRRRHELTDAEWVRLVPLLPPRQPGKRRNDDRLVVDGILWKLATGAPWRDLPERYGPWQTVSSRFRRWQQAGIGQRILADLQGQADAAGRLDWDLPVVDGTVVRAHQHAAGAKGGEPAPRRSAGAGAGSAPSSMSAPRAVASR